MTGKKALVALAVTAALGVLGATSTAWSQRDSGRNSGIERGGYVIPGSKEGVNPAYHPEYFGAPPNQACFQRFKSYDAASGTYLGTDGRRHPCRLR